MSENFLDGSGDKPISWWMFEESSTPALDGNTTNNNDLAWTGGFTLRDTSKFKQGASCITSDGSGQAAVAGATLASLSSNFPFKGATTGFTIGGWVHFSAYAVDAATAMFVSGTQGFQFYNSVASRPGFFLSIDSSGTGRIQTDATYSTAAWHHLIARWNGANRAGAGANDELSYWFDGVKQSTTRTQFSSVSLVTAGSGFQLWTYGSGVELHAFDEWFVFDVALLDTQIADIYNFGLAGVDEGGGSASYTKRWRVQ